MAFTAQSIQGRVSKNGGPITDNTWESDGSEVYVQGQLLVKDDDGTVADAVSGAGIHAIYLGATQTAALATGTKLPVMELTAATRFIAQLHSGPPANANPAQAMIGERYGLAFSSNIWSVDIDDESTVDVEVTDVWDNPSWYATGENGGGNYGLVEVKFLNTTNAPA